MKSVLAVVGLVALIWFIAYVVSHMEMPAFW